MDFLVPDLGEGLAQVEIVEWLVKVGDRVGADQPIVVVQTDKAIVEIPAPEGGRLAARGGQVGDVLSVGALLATISEACSSMPATLSPTEASPPTVRSPRPLAAPSVRRQALEAGVDLADVPGSGPGGRITSDDVTSWQRRSQDPSDEAAALTATPIVTERSDQTIPIRGLRRQVAQAVTTAWQTIPHITEFRQIDASGLVDAYRRLKVRLASDGIDLTVSAMIAYTVASVVPRHPSLNATLDAERDVIIHRGACHLGVATATVDGILVPVLQHADRKSLRTIASELSRLSVAARERTVTPAELRGGTFTISNYGTFGTWLGTPIIRNGEAAILGIGRIQDAVVALESEPVVRPTVALALAADHRINDGVHLAAFVDDLEVVLRDPLLLLAEER